MDDRREIGGACVACPPMVDAIALAEASSATAEASAEYSNVCPLMKRSISFGSSKKTISDKIGENLTTFRHSYYRFSAAELNATEGHV